jgi:hypothetical protein
MTILITTVQGVMAPHAGSIGETENFKSGWVEQPTSAMEWATFIISENTIPSLEKNFSIAPEINKNRNYKMAIAHVNQGLRFEAGDTPLGRGWFLKAGGSRCIAATVTPDMTIVDPQGNGKSISYYSNLVPQDWDRALAAFVAKQGDYWDQNNPDNKCVMVSDSAIFYAERELLARESG